MRNLRVSRSFATIAGLAIGVSAVSVPLAFALTSNGSTTTPPPNSAPAAWPSNASGQSYGSIQGVTSSASVPDLILVIATDGKVGYVHKAQWLAATQVVPADPAAAVAQAQSGGNTATTTLPVYAQDGVTQVGVFVAGGGTTSTTAPPPAN